MIVNSVSLFMGTRFERIYCDDPYERVNLLRIVDPNLPGGVCARLSLVCGSGWVGLTKQTTPL